MALVMMCGDVNQLAKNRRHAGIDGPLDRMVRRLGAASGEDDFAGLRADQISDLGAGTLDGVACGSAVGVRAGRDCRSACAGYGIMASSTAGSIGVVAL